ncbi:site-specific integrase [Wenyingzhuangia sp. IMCC45574]
MQRATFTILFFIKKTKTLKDGTAPIYLRVTVNGKRSEVAIKRSVQPNIWDTARNKVKGNSKESKTLNEYLNSVRGQIQNCQQALQEQGKTITAKALTNAFLGKGEKQWTLKELFENHNKQMKELIGVEYSGTTHSRYETAFNHIMSFCKIHYKNQHLLLTEINHSFVTSFESHLKTNAKCQHNSAMKHVKALKKVINLALANEYLKKDPFVNYKVVIKDKDRECLNKFELERIVEKEFSTERLDVVRDLFVFQCYTGLAFADLKKLHRKDVVIGIDGNKWLVVKRQKTKTECKIPILPTAEAILNKYKNHLCNEIENRLLPVPSNQKMNEYLKEIQTLCKIPKKLHTHLARHTFATTVTLNNGVPMETVSKLLGHKKIVTTQIYSRVLESKISQDMAVLRGA